MAGAPSIDRHSQTPPATTVHVHVWNQGVSEVEPLSGPEFGNTLVSLRSAPWQQVFVYFLVTPSDGLGIDRDQGECSVFFCSRPGMSEGLMKIS